MASFNKITLIGNVGRDPEVRVIGDNRKVASFSVATNKKYTDSQGNTVDKTEWFRVSFWNKLADITENYVKQGSLVYIEGELSTKEYTDKDGKNRVTLEVLGQTLNLLSSKNEGGGQATAAPAYSAALKPQQPAPVPPDLSGSDVDDLPF
jgi:single-strand DNA-binding protein